jgi:lipopolysaccharide transport system permease protein
MKETGEIETVIDSKKRWNPFDWRELIRYKDLFRFRVINQYKAQQRQTVLSYLWVFLDPAINILFFTIVFGGLVKVDTQETPYLVFNTASMAGWIFLKNAMNFSVLSLNAEKVLLQKIYFPRVFIPVVPTIVYLPNFAIQLVLSLVLIAFFGFYPGWEIIWLFPILLIMLVMSFSLGLLISSFVVQFRDLELIWKYALQFMVYLVPVAYPLSVIPEKWMGLYQLNPLVPLIQNFRYALIGGESNLGGLAYSSAFALILFMVSSLIYRMREPTIVDAL